MGKRTTQIIEEIQAGKSAKEVERSLSIAADLLRGVPTGVEEIDRERVSEPEAKQIQDALFVLLSREKDPRQVAWILSALSCSRDTSLLPFWREQLARSLEASRAASAMLYASLMALENLDEPAFEDSITSRCLTDVQVNIGQAERYLRERGIFVPL